MESLWTTLLVRGLPTASSMDAYGLDALALAKRQLSELIQSPNTPGIDCHR
jgi:hypothetical protein